MTPATTNALPALAGRRSARVVARSLFALTKPRIIELLLVTTIPTMLLAQRGLPSARLLVLTLVGGAFASTWRSPATFRAPLAAKSVCVAWLTVGG